MRKTENQCVAQLSHKKKKKENPSIMFNYLIYTFTFTKFQPKLLYINHVKISCFVSSEHVGIDERSLETNLLLIFPSSIIDTIENNHTSCSYKHNSRNKISSKSYFFLKFLVKWGEICHTIFGTHPPPPNFFNNLYLNLTQIFAVDCSQTC